MDRTPLVHCSDEGWRWRLSTLGDGTVVASLESGEECWLLPLSRAAFVRRAPGPSLSAEDTVRFLHTVRHMEVPCARVTCGSRSEHRPSPLCEELGIPDRLVAPPSGAGIAPFHVTCAGAHLVCMGEARPERLEECKGVTLASLEGGRMRQVTEAVGEGTSSCAVCCLPLEGILRGQAIAPWMWAPALGPAAEIMSFAAGDTLVLCDPEGPWSGCVVSPDDEGLPPGGNTVRREWSASMCLFFDASCTEVLCPWTVALADPLFSPLLDAPARTPAPDMVRDCVLLALDWSSSTLTLLAAGTDGAQGTASLEVGQELAATALEELRVRLALRADSATEEHALRSHWWAVRTSDKRDPKLAVHGLVEAADESTWSVTLSVRGALEGRPPRVCQVPECGGVGPRRGACGRCPLPPFAKGEDAVKCFVAVPVHGEGCDLVAGTEEGEIKVWRVDKKEVEQMWE